MMMKRHGNTGHEMVNSGAWVKVARKHYRHVSGVEVAYDCNRYIWKVSDGTAWSSLWVARHNAEKHFAAMPARVVG
jgi:hypothetical protein